MIISFVFGTRPEVIKMAPIILEAKKRRHDCRIIFTGQHKTMAAPLLKFFGIKPTLNLNVMSPNQTLTSLSAKILNALDKNKNRIKSDVLLVQGDTSSAFISAYWAFCNNIQVGHVEAGLRTHDLRAPFPEEANRQLIGRIASIHFAPTVIARESLLIENTEKNKIAVVGNSAIDALFLTLNKIKSTKSLKPENKLNPKILSFIEHKKLVLVTGHRRESFGHGFLDICKGIRSIADADSEIRIVYPVHLNPNVKGPVFKLLGRHPRIMLCDPISYVPFVTLMQRAAVLLTDSGGIQEEGPSLKKPIIVMREKTERPEGVKAKFSVLVGTNPKKIKKETLLALKKGCIGRGKNPYGDGKTAKRIIKKLENLF